MPRTAAHLTRIRFTAAHIDFNRAISRPNDARDSSGPLRFFHAFSATDSCGLEPVEPALRTSAGAEISDLCSFIPITDGSAEEQQQPFPAVAVSPRSR